MNLRVTKKQIVLAVVLLPVLYVLNTGPMLFCATRYPPFARVASALIWPVAKLTENTALHGIYDAYLNWWFQRGYEDFIRY